ncbi:MAG TPA: hypothetical protein VJV79_23295 [Polyangiaceae bacterium]|nr:hypothetical protein [Polyangiaceae bacterium]
MRRVSLFVVLALSSACGSDPASGGPAAGGAGSGTQGGATGSASGANNAGSGATNDGALHGSVVVTLQQPADGDGYTTAIGRFFDGAQPRILSLEARSEQAGCTLYVPHAPFCSNPCAPAVCTANDVCSEYPAPRGVGTLSLKGIGVPLELQPSSSMIVYQSPSLEYPPCEPGAPVTASATGVSVSADCIAPLQLMGPDPIPIVEDVPLRLSWLPAADGARSRVRIKLDVSHHGGSKGEIDCDVADTGKLEIAASLVTELLGLGLAGFPTINVNRVVVGTDPTNPNVTLVLSSDLTRAVDTGVVSCLDKDGCPDDQACLPSGICG